jgi:ribonuclease VapC
MIVVDASALLAIYLSEPEREDCIQRIRNTTVAWMSPVNLWEALVRASVVNGASGAAEIENLVANLNIEIVPVDATIARAAADAFARFGKRAPARLNLGDCFAYALAKSSGARLLFKGDDFTKTDILAA